jgi:hypothetical protein
MKVLVAEGREFRFELVEFLIERDPAVELLLAVHLRSKLGKFSLECLVFMAAVYEGWESFAGAFGEREKGLKEGGVEFAEIEGSGERRTGCWRFLEKGGEAGAGDPLGGVSLAGALVGGAMSEEALGIYDFEDDGLRDGKIEELEEIRVNARSLELEVEDLDFWNLIGCREFDRSRGEFRVPTDLLDFPSEERLKPSAWSSLLQDLSLRDDSVDESGWREGEHDLS